MSHAQYFARRREAHKNHRERVWYELRTCETAADHRRLQAAVSDWLFATSSILRFTEAARSWDVPGLRELWADAPLASDVDGLREAREVFGQRGVELLPVWFLRNVTVALTNAAIVAFDLAVHPPLLDDPTEQRATAATAKGGEV